MSVLSFRHPFFSLFVFPFFFFAFFLLFIFSICSFPLSFSFSGAQNFFFASIAARFLATFPIKFMFLSRLRAYTLEASFSFFLSLIFFLILSFFHFSFFSFLFDFFDFFSSFVFFSCFHRFFVLRFFSFFLRFFPFSTSGQVKGRISERSEATEVPKILCQESVEVVNTLRSGFLSGARLSMCHVAGESRGSQNYPTPRCRFFERTETSSQDRHLRRTVEQTRIMQKKNSRLKIVFRSMLSWTLSRQNCLSEALRTPCAKESNGIRTIQSHCIDPVSCSDVGKDTGANGMEISACGRRREHGMRSFGSKSVPDSTASAVFTADLVHSTTSAVLAGERQRRREGAACAAC